MAEHSAQLLRRFGSLVTYCNEGFEAAHKLQRLLYALCTSHDANPNHSSVVQIMRHFYLERLLGVRYLVRQAIAAFSKPIGSSFWYHACGWKKGSKTVQWTTEEQQCIHL